MAKIPDDVIAEIKARVRLSELVGKTVKLQRAGKSMKGKSPFTNEKTPSFYVHDDRGYFKCFSSGKGGDAIAWVMETERRTFAEAVEQLAAMVGVQVREATPEEKAQSSRADRLRHVLALAQEVFTDALENPHDERAAIAREYLVSRGFDSDSWRRFGIGYSPPGAGLTLALREARVTGDEMISAGVAFESTPHLRALYRHRITFPVIDSRGHVVTFGARALGDDKPKYLNGPATSLFDKSATLYGLQESRQALAKTGTLYCVEGYFDVIAVRRAGGAACAPMGTALTDGQLEQLWRLVECPVLCFDGDAAGQKAAIRAARLALPHLRAGRNLSFVILPGEDDPDTIFQRSGSLALLTMLTGRRPHFTVIWDDMCSGLDLKDPSDIGRLRQRCAETLRLIDDSAVRLDWRRAMGQQLRALGGEAATPPRPTSTKEERPAAASAAMRSEGKASASWADIQAAALLAPLLANLDRIERHIDLLAEIPAGRFDALRQDMVDWGSGNVPQIERPDDYAAVKRLAPAGLGYEAEGWERAARQAIAGAGAR